MESRNRLVILLKAAAAATDDAGSSEDDYVKELRKLGFDVVTVPTLQFQFKNLDQLQSCLHNADGHSGLIFTSPRTVEAVINSCPDWHSSVLKEWVTLRCYAVGPSTASTSVKLLQLNCVGESAGNAEQLAHFIGEDLPDMTKPLLFPCSSISRETLPQLLHEKGITLKSVAVYDTTAHPQLITRLNEIYEKMGNAEYVVFFSPSGVKNSSSFFTTSAQHLNSKFVAIGPTTCEALMTNGLRCSGTAAVPSAKGLVDAISRMEHSSN